MNLYSEIPNTLTYLRIILAPILAILMIMEKTLFLSTLVFILFILASITDWLDGYLARKMKKISDIGRMLDPIADKLLIISCLFSLSLTQKMNLFFHIPILAIVCREIFISGLREFMGQKKVILYVSNLAKWKTTLQMIAIGVFLFNEIINDKNLFSVGMLFLWISSIITIYTGYNYFKKTVSNLN